MSLADRIRSARHAAGLSQGDVGRLIGVTRGCLAQWETSRAPPKPENLAKLALVLNVTPEHLLGEDGDDAPPLAPMPPAERDWLRLYLPLPAAWHITYPTKPAALLPQNV